MSDFKEKLDALCDSYELEIYALDATIQRVRELHRYLPCNCGDGICTGFCEVCDDEYPCPTIKALDGEQ
jgi:hypothetical protein